MPPCLPALIGLIALLNVPVPCYSKPVQLLAVSCTAGARHNSERAHVARGTVQLWTQCPMHAYECMLTCRTPCCTHICAGAVQARRLCKSCHPSMDTS